ncbi:MAG: hypothetical protein IJL97_01215 [Lachnospiraceae bacterium]|nr:hypothetical protein [Lachnospiraceae bacterium]
MKKIISILIIAVMVFSLAACSGGKETEAPEVETTDRGNSEIESAEKDTGETETDAPDTEVPETDESETEAPETESETDIPQTDPAESDKYIGFWAADRAMMGIGKDPFTEDGNWYKVYIQWSDSVGEYTIWAYDAYYDGEALVTFETGKRFRYTLLEDGDTYDKKVIFEDGAAKFEMDENGKITWTDFKEESDRIVTFERDSSYTTKVPSPTEIRSEFFEEIADLNEGEAGTALKLADGAYDALSFGMGYDVWSFDQTEFKANVAKAWADLTEEQRTGFAANIKGVAELIEKCREDWDANKGVFEDAGKAGEMMVLLDCPLATLAWDEVIEAASEAAVHSGPDEATEGEEYIGMWQSDRISLLLGKDYTKNEEAEPVYMVYIVWSSSADTTTTWAYDCYFDGEALVSNETGVKTNFVYSEENDIFDRQIVFEDGATSLVLGEDGKLTWTDYKEEPGQNEKVFEKIYGIMEAPDPEDLADDFFRGVAEIDDASAGSSLKLADGTYKALQFALEETICLGRQDEL